MLFYRIVRIERLKNMTIDNWIQVFIPILGIFLSVIFAYVTYYLTQRENFNSTEKRLKEDFYEQFINLLSKNTIANEKV